MSWWVWGAALWLVASVAAVAFHAAWCYARDLKAERERVMAASADMADAIASLRRDIHGADGLTHDDKLRMGARLRGLWLDAIEIGHPTPERGQ